MPTQSRTKNTQQTNDGSLIAGLQKNQSTLPSSWTVLGIVYTLVQLVAIVANRVAAVAKADSDKAQWQSSLQAARQELAQTKAIVAAVRQQLKVWNADTPKALSDYGLTPKKASGPKSPVTNVLAAAKGKVTRAARGTKGPLQKARIVGITPTTVSISTATEQVSSSAAAPEPTAPVNAAAAPSGGSSQTPSK